MHGICTSYSFESYLQYLCFSQINKSDGILVVGSSLEVFSVFRLILRAIEKQIDIAVLNLGPTRIDRAKMKDELNIQEGDNVVQHKYKHIKIEDDCEKVLQWISQSCQK